MLAVENRLKKKKDFEAVFEKGKSLKTDIFWCRTANNNLAHTRVGFVVSKKVSPKAVVRNKVRRRLQSAVAPIIGGLQQPKDIVVVALPGIVHSDFSEIKAVMVKTFTKIV